MNLCKPEKKLNFCVYLQSNYKKLSLKKDNFFKHKYKCTNGKSTAENIELIDRSISIIDGSASRNRTRNACFQARCAYHSTNPIC